MLEATLEAKILTPGDYKIFKPVYTDFKNKAYSEYKFELEPLEFNDFTQALEKNLINCIVLFEDEIPVSFLVYTTAISEAIELNIIHSLSSENRVKRNNALIKAFLENTKAARTEKVVCYPMLGTQKDLITETSRFGFKFIGIVVLRFLTESTNSKEIFKMATLEPMDSRYTLVKWNEEYFNDAVYIINESFKNSSDALFDPRFKTTEGTADILTKITENIYAEFLPEASTVLLCDGKPVGFCFMNLTGGKIANIPIVGLLQNHQGRGLSKHMLKHSLEQIIELHDTGLKHITEINTCTETNNFQALKLYRHLGFKEDYNYPQAYLPSKK